MRDNAAKDTKTQPTSVVETGGKLFLDPTCLTYLDLDKERKMISSTKSAKPRGVKTSATYTAKFVFFSLLGIGIFFVPVTINGTSTIPLGHIKTALQQTFPVAVEIFVLALIVLGATYPFVTGTWKKTPLHIVFTVLKLLSVPAAFAIYFEVGPGWLLADSIGPYLFETLVITVGIIVPIGSAFLGLLTGYGLLEFIGVLLRPTMRVVWKVPGRSAVDAMASFVASFFIGLLITDNLFKRGKYSIKEATIIATGFSTVTVAFMLVIAETLNLMGIWNLYFWSTLVVTIVTTAITVRIWPLSRTSNEYYSGREGDPEEAEKASISSAWRAANETAANSSSLAKSVWTNLRGGLVMTMNVIPLIMSVGLIALVLAEYTPVFEVLGYALYPLTWLLQIPEPLLAAQALVIQITEMFIPSLLVTGAPLVTKFIIAVQSVAAIVFFSAYIPAIVATDIPISIPKLLVIWLQRTVITTVLATPIAFVFL